MRRLIAKTGMLAAALFISQCLLTVCLLQTAGPRWRSRLLRFDTLEKLERALEAKTDILFFGDSTLFAGRLKDRDPRTIPALLHALLPGHTLADLSHRAYHPGIYQEFCRTIARAGKPPKLVIIPINLRSFSPEWYMRPQYQFEREKVILGGGPKMILRLAFERMLRSLGIDSAPVGSREFLATPVFNGDVPVGRVKDFTSPDSRYPHPEQVRRKILFFYMYSLQPGHRNLRALTQAARVLSARAIPVVFYVTPIDWQTGEKSFPGVFSRRLETNLAVIRAALAGSGAGLLDLSTAVPRPGFAWERLPSEYLGQEGKMVVAERLSVLVKGYLEGGSLNRPVP